PDHEAPSSARRAGSLCSRLLGPGDRPQTMEERLEREGRRNCQLQRSARVARCLQAVSGERFATVCSILYVLLAVLRVYQRPLGAPRAAGVCHGTRRAAGVEEFVGVRGACQREVALAAIARLAALQLLARALEVAAAGARKRQPLGPAEPQGARDLDGCQGGEA